MKKFITKKSLGQNLLVNQGILDKIVTAAEITSNDLVLEIGPGTGNLTKKLIQKAGRVIAIEKDRRLVSELQSTIKKSGTEIIEGDILKFNIGNLKLKDGKYKVVGNIPYYITSQLIRIIFEKWPRPELIVLTIQKEVAQRIMAKPPHMNLLALSVQYYSEPKIISYISRGSFRPIPKVDSAIIKLVTRDRRQETRTEQFFKLIKAGFSAKRKQLINNLSGKFGIMKDELKDIFDKTGLKHNTRAEELSTKEWEKLKERLLKYLN